jgi:hypothetical protein
MEATMKKVNKVSTTLDELCSGVAEDFIPQPLLDDTRHAVDKLSAACAGIPVGAVALASTFLCVHAMRQSDTPKELVNEFSIKLLSLMSQFSAQALAAETKGFTS